MTRGTLFILSAPSGTGKTTVLRQVMATVTNLVFSVSHTTRKPRSGERDGVDYHFIDRQRFEAMREAGDFFEWAEVHGNLYGTSRAAVDAQLDAGVDVILDIDVQGARQVRQAAPEAVLLFIAPPSWEELERRLTGRGTDGEATIRLRLANARCEMAASGEYDYVVLNDDIDRAAAIVTGIILAARSRNRRGFDGRPLPLPEADPEP